MLFALSIARTALSNRLAKLQVQHITCTGSNTSLASHEPSSALTVSGMYDIHRSLPSAAKGAVHCRRDTCFGLLS